MSAALRNIYDAGLRPYALVGPVEWLESNLDLSRDPTSEAMGPPDIRGLTPYLVEPLEWWARGGRRRGTLVAVEQIGKSSTWKWGLIYLLAVADVLGLIVYESDEKAEDENADSLEPMMRGVPSIDAMLSMPGARRKDHYRLGNSIIQFGGAGSEIASTRNNLVIGDEVELWRGYSTRVDNVRNLDKRGRTFRDFKRWLVSSPQDESGLIWREFLDGSQGRWYLRCLGCGGLTMRSSDIGGRKGDDGNWRGGLQFEIAEHEGAKRAVADSLRLVCPQCSHAHPESDKAELNRRGAYKHKHPERRTDPHTAHESWQVGALASQMPGLDWSEIAAAQLRAGDSGSYGDKKVFFNSFRGLPLTENDLQDGRSGDMSRDALIQAHACDLPAPADIVCRVMSADTQAAQFYWVIRGFDARGSSWLLDNGKAESPEALFGEVWAGDYHGGRCKAGIIDTGGHRAKELYPHILRTPGVLGYKGNTRIERKWKTSGQTNKLIIANALAFQADLLYALHTQLDQGKAPFWALPYQVDPEYQKQLLNLRPQEGRRNGNQFTMWRGTGNDHYFDAEKMALVGWEVWQHQRRSLSRIPSQIEQMRAAARKRREAAAGRA